MKKRAPKIILALIVLAVVASVLTPPSAHPGEGAAFLSGARVDPEVLTTLRRSCGDCHSYQTLYPWYSYVAPVSWLVQNDVAEGRRHLNFSTWSEYSNVRRQRLLSEIANQVQDGEMPLAMYTLIHRDARLSQADTAAIFQWTQTERARLISENGR